MGASVTGQQTTEGRLESLTELIAGAVGSGSKLRLYKADLSPGPDSVRADFIAQEADFSGYAAATLAFDPPAIGGGSMVRAVSDAAAFAQTATTVTCMVAGAWLDTQTAAGPPAVNKAITYYPFPGPINFNQIGREINCQVVIVAPDLSGFLDLLN